jgi:hypothetical protein
MSFLATVYINGVIAAELKSVAQCVSAQEQGGCAGPPLPGSPDG